MRTAKPLRGGPLTAEDEKVRARALADTHLDLHDQLDRAYAYGWPHGLPDDEVFTRVKVGKVGGRRFELNGRLTPA